MAESLLSFGFKHINEDQLWEVIERVKRDKRKRKEIADWLTYSSRKKSDILSKTNLSSCVSTERGENGTESCNQSPSDVIERQKHLIRPEFTDYLQISGKDWDNYTQLISDTHESSHLLQKIYSIRRSMCGVLDSILSQSELKVVKEKIFSDAPEKFEEPEHKRRVMSYRYRILRLDYQLVMVMRKLSRNIAEGYLLCGNLYKCHATASKLLQVFVNGWCDLMKMNQMRDKFCDLLKSVIILGRVCETIHANVGDPNGLDDFLIEAMQMKCNAILHAVDKGYSDKIHEKKNTSAEGVMKVKRTMGPSWQHQSKESIDLKRSGDSVYIPMKTFKRLAKNHFDVIESTRTSHERSIKKLSLDNKPSSGRRICTKLGQGKEMKLLSNVLQRKTPLSTSRSMKNVGQVHRKSNSSSEEIEVPNVEHEIKNFDINTFSKNLCDILEKEISANMKYIFSNLSFGQLQVYESVGKNNGKHVFYMDNHSEILGKFKNSLHVCEFEEIPLEIECRSFGGKMGAEETNIDKQNEDLSSLKNELTVSQRLPGSKTSNSLKPASTLITSKNKMVESSSTSDEELNSSSNREEGKELLTEAKTKGAACSAQRYEPWDAIGRISDKLIEECIKNISDQLDYCILQNMFDGEFL